MFTNYKNPIATAGHALVAATAVVALLLATFFVAEPQISRGQTTGEFTITQQIVDETSFSTLPTDVQMVGSINGVTGGQATGTTQFTVQSNNSTGYYVEIDFFDNVGDHAMLGTSTQSQAIRDYDGDVAGEPSFGFTASTAAQFAYTVLATTTSDLDQSFLHLGGNCNQSGGNQYPTAGDYCWKAPSTSAFRVIDRDSAAVTGATSTLVFRVNVPSNATPTPTAENYIATATLSVFIQ